jgi:tetratricopeptide (TPR) repeat protein/tRNA A-37 threonylcarbamoyl transferase component Bud32
MDDANRTLAPDTGYSLSPTVFPEVPGYEILSVLGRGGMGVVYQARQERLHRFVALKMILAGDHASEEAKIRFLSEAEAVAKVRHPGIVQVYEFGTHHGHPFFALEYVEGGTLEQFLRATPQPPRVAAAMVAPLADAVAAAHAQGIIHRDLKPANVLLASGQAPPAGDGNGAQELPLPVLKITDFGLAKRLNTGDGLTATGAIMGTPSYMAPEQAQAQKGVGPAADLYALGAILYECLTGRPPFKGTTPLDTLHQVLHQDVLPVRQLQPRVPKDLETICHKCLHKEPDKRYATAQALAADLRRYLAGQPIQARPVGRLERGWKWCRRYPAVAALLCLTTLTSLIAGTAALWALRAEDLAKQQELQARTERDQKEAQRARADTERQKAVEQAELAKAIKGFLQFDLLKLADPKEQYREQASGLKYDAEIKLRDVVLRASKAIDGKFPTQPLVEAELRVTLGSTLFALGRADLAVTHGERVRILYTRHLGPDHPETLRCIGNLATIYASLGRHDEALTLREATLDRAKVVLGPDHPDTLRGMTDLAGAYYQENRVSEALKLYEASLYRWKALHGTDPPETLRCMSNLAYTYASLGRHAEALTLRKETLARERAVLGPDHPDTLTSMSSLAGSFFTLGQYSEALKLCEETLSRRKTVLGPDHPLTLDSMSHLTICYSALNRHADALQLCREACNLREQLALRDPHDLDNLVNLGGLQCNLGNALCRDAHYAESLSAFDRGLEHLQAVLRKQPNHAEARLFLRNSYGARATAYEQLHRYDEADADWAKALELSSPAQKAMVTRNRDQWKAKRQPPATSKP